MIRLLTDGGGSERPAGAPTLAVPACWLAWLCSSSLARGRLWRTCSSAASVGDSATSNITSVKDPLESACLDSSGVLDPMPLDHQFLARGEGEVVEGVGIAGKVDLGGQVLVPRRRDEVVDVRRALAVTAEQMEYLLGRTVRRAAIGRRVTRDQNRKRSFIAQPRFAAFQRAGSIRDQATTPDYRIRDGQSL